VRVDEPRQDRAAGAVEHRPAVRNGPCRGSTATMVPPSTTTAAPPVRNCEPSNARSALTTYRVPSSPAVAIAAFSGNHRRDNLDPSTRSWQTLDAIRRPVAKIFLIPTGSYCISNIDSLIGEPKREPTLSGTTHCLPSDHLACPPTPRSLCPRTSRAIADLPAPSTSRLGGRPSRPS
jgi:hypothetical protein